MKENSTPFLSVITINRNNADGLKKTIDSVFTTFEGFEAGEVEYIIIDGASTDDSKEIIEQAAVTDAGKKYIAYWISEPDKGIYNAMNKGIMNSRGTLINIMNSGDCLIPYSLCGLKEIHKTFPEAVLYGGMENCINGKYTGKVYSPVHTCLEGVGLCHQSVFIPRALHDRFGMYDESFRICADYDFLSKLYKNNVDFQYIHKLICGYDMDGVSANMTEIREKETMIIRKKYGFYTEQKKTFPSVVKSVLKALCPYGILRMAGKI